MCLKVGNMTLKVLVSFYGIGRDIEVIGDKAYKDCMMEDVLREEGINFNPVRSKRERKNGVSAWSIPREEYKACGRGCV